MFGLAVLLQKLIKRRKMLACYSLSIQGEVAFSDLLVYIFLTFILTLPS